MTGIRLCVCACVYVCVCARARLFVPLFKGSLLQARKFYVWTVLPIRVKWHK